MSDEEWWTFLSRPVRPAVLSTVRSDGLPHAAPIWYDLEGATLVFNTGAATVKGRNLHRDPRAVLCVQDHEPPFAFVLVEGAAGATGGHQGDGGHGRGRLTAPRLAR